MAVRQPPGARSRDRRAGLDDALARLVDTVDLTVGPGARLVVTLQPRAAAPPS